MKSPLERALAALQDLNEVSKHGIPLPAEIDEAMESLAEAIAEMEKAEPVGYVYSDAASKQQSKCAVINRDIPNGTPLYTHPQQQTIPEVWNPEEPKIGKNYEAGLWSRRNWEAMMEDQLAAAPKLEDKP